MELLIENATDGRFREASTRERLIWNTPEGTLCSAYKKKRLIGNAPDGNLLVQRSSVPRYASEGTLCEAYNEERFVKPAKGTLDTERSRGNAL